MKVFYKFLLLVIGMMATTGVFASDLPIWKGAYGSNVLTAEKFCDIILNHPDQLNCSQESACDALAVVLNFYAKRDGWVKENGNEAKFTGPKILILLKQGDLFVNSSAEWKKGEVLLASVNPVSHNVSIEFERGSRGLEAVILFDPNNLKGIDLSSGKHKQVMIASGICGNFAKVETKKTANANTGSFVVTEPGEYKVEGGNTGNGITIIFKPEIHVSAEANAEAKSESTSEENDDVVSTTEEDENKPFQHIGDVSDNKVETVFVKEIVYKDQPLENNSIVHHDGRWLRYVAGTGFVIITGLAILRALSGYQGYLQPYGGYNVIPARTFNTIEGNTWQTTSGGLIQGNAGGGSYTNYGNAQGYAENTEW